MHLGDILAMLGGYGTGCDNMAYRIDPVAQEFLKSKSFSMDKVLLGIDEEFQGAKNLLLETTGESSV